MHPLAPSSTHVLVDQTELVRKRRRRGKLRMATLMRVSVVCGEAALIAAGVMWLWHESPHPEAAVAIRESPIFEARNLQPLLETANPAKLAAYAMKNGPMMPELADHAPPPPVRSSPSHPSPVLPVWLLADAPEFAGAANTNLSREQTTEQLRQSLRERGARQMVTSVRFAMLNVAELLGLNSTTWAACMGTAAANETRTSAALLTFYLYHLDRDGDGAGVKALLAALERGVPEEQAVKEHILEGRSVAQLGRDMMEAFGAAGVELQFTRRGGAAFRP